MAYTYANYTPSGSGQQQPGKYPFVGSNYKQYGEQPGWIYDPYSDKYWIDNNAQKKLLQSQGQIPKDKSLAQTVLPIAGAAFALQGGKVLAENIPNYLSQGKDALLGIGDSSAQAASNATAAASSIAQPSDALLSLGASSNPVSFAGEPLVSDYGYSLGSSTTPVNTPTITEGAGFNWGKGVQGVAGGLQAYQGLKEFQEGDKIGGGLHMIAGGSNIAAALGSSTGSAIAPYATAASGAYGMYKGINAKSRTDTAKSGAETGAGIGYIAGGPIGAVIGAPLGALTGALLGNIKGGKSKDQQSRDQIRKALLGIGVSDNSYQVNLSDGTKFDIGKDGKYKYSNFGTNVDGKTERRAYEVDWSNPLAKDTVDALLPKVHQFTPDEKQQSWLTGMLANAAMSNAKTKEDVIKNVDSIFAPAAQAQQPQTPQGQSMQFIDPRVPQAGAVDPNQIAAKETADNLLNNESQNLKALKEKALRRSFFR